MSIDSTSRLMACALIAAAASFMVSCKGPMGPEGAAGGPGLSGTQIVSVQGTLLPVQSGSTAATGILALRVECPAGKSVLAGGFAAVGDGSQFVHAYQSFPISATAWEIAVQNGYSGSVAITAFATCASIQ